MEPRGDRRSGGGHGLDEDSIRLALDALKGSLKRLADRDVTRAMAVQLHLLGGYKPAEIRETLELTAGEYRAATTSLREALRPTLHET